MSVPACAVYYCFELFGFMNVGGIVKNTLRPPIPVRCDSEWKNLMEQCWSADPDTRPSFTEITKALRYMSATLEGKGPSPAR